jgi:hypothetical protein
VDVASQTQILYEHEMNRYLLEGVGMLHQYNLKRFGASCPSNP